MTYKKVFQVFQLFQVYIFKGNELTNQTSLLGAGCWLAGWLAGSTIQLNHALMDAIAYFAVTWMHM
jgi:hypothetical protein